MSRAALARAGLALLIAAPALAGPAPAPTPAALCARMLALAAQDPSAPPPIPKAVCEGLLANHQRTLDAPDWAAFARCIQAASQARDVDACNPGHFAPAGPPLPPTAADLPTVPATGPLPERLAALLTRVAALAAHHAPRCDAFSRALDAEQATHAALLAELALWRAQPAAQRSGQLAPLLPRLQPSVTALTAVVGDCPHPLTTTLIGALP